MIDRPITLAATSLVISGERSDAFEQGRLSGAVFADDDSDRVVEIELKSLAQERQAKRIGRRVRYAGLIDPNTLEVRRRQSDRAALHGADSSGEIISIATSAQTHGWESFTTKLEFLHDWAATAAGLSR